MSRRFHEDFLAELRAIDDFLSYRTGDVAHVQREDPDVRRLVESIAFFAARTRSAASDQLRHAMLQLARGQLDEFLSSAPARGLLQATPAGLLTDTAHLPAGTLLRLTTADGELGLFSTMADTTLRPLQLDLAELQLRSGGGFRLVLRIRARREVVELTEPLTIYVSYLQDYLASLRIHHRLRRHLLLESSASVFYDAPPDPARDGVPCEISFGCAPRAHAAPGVGGRIEQLRTFFHFPVKELCFHVSLPRPAVPWRQAWICLDLDDEWPSDLVIHKDVFRLFVIPIENLVSEAALPIKCDGTRSRFPIAPARPDVGLALHSVIGVFQETMAGREPVLPLHLASGGPSYELEKVVDDFDGREPREPHLVLRMPEAFTSPRLVSVEARWSQPDFDQSAVGKLVVKLQTRHVHGVALRMLGELSPHRQSPLWRDPAAMLHVLSRRASRVLERRDLITLMTLLGADQDSYHAGLDTEILHVETYEEPADLRRGGGLRQVYRVTVDSIDDERLALMDDYLRCIELLLDAWSANPVRLEIHRRRTSTRPRLTLGSGT